MFNKENSTQVILWNIAVTLACIWMLINHFFLRCMMLNTTNLFNLIPVWMTLTFNQGHRVMGKSRAGAIKWHEVAWTFVMADYVREMRAKNVCKYGNYGSFEHLLFLCVCMCVCVCVFYFERYCFYVRTTKRGWGRAREVGWSSIICPFGFFCFSFFLCVFVCFCGFSVVVDYYFPLFSLLLCRQNNGNVDVFETPHFTLVYQCPKDVIPQVEQKLDSILKVIKVTRVKLDDEFKRYSGKCLCVCVCLCVYVCLCVCERERERFASMCISHICVCVCIYLSHVCVCIYMCSYTYMCVCVYIYRYIHTHTHMYV